MAGKSAAMHENKVIWIPLYFLRCHIKLGKGGVANRRHEKTASPLDVPAVQNELGMWRFRHGNPPGLSNAVVGFLGLAGRHCRGAVPVFVVDTEAKGGSGQGEEIKWELLRYLAKKMLRHYCLLLQNLNKSALPHRVAAHWVAI